MKKRSVKTGLFLGRFQPFHLGHLSAIKQALAQVDFLIIGIGSSQYSRTSDNPFTSAERRAMIADSLADEKIPPDRFKIVEVSDIHNDATWPAHVRSLVDPFDILFTGSKNTRELFEKYDKTEVRPIVFEFEISATKIRELIRNKGDWQKNISQAAAKVILKYFSRG